MNKLNITLFTLFALLLSININSMQASKKGSTNADGFLYKLHEKCTTLKDSIDESSFYLGTPTVVFGLFMLGSLMFTKGGFKDSISVKHLAAGCASGVALFWIGNLFLNDKLNTLCGKEDFNKKRWFGFVAGTAASIYLLTKGTNSLEKIFSNITRCNIKNHSMLLSKITGFGSAGLILGLMPNLKIS